MFILLCKEMLCSAVLQRHLSRYLLILFYPFDTSVTRNLPASSSLSTRHIFSLYPFIFFGGFFFLHFLTTFRKGKNLLFRFFFPPASMFYSSLRILWQSPPSIPHRTFDCTWRWAGWAGWPAIFFLGWLVVSRSCRSSPSCVFHHVYRFPSIIINKKMRNDRRKNRLGNFILEIRFE